MKIKLYIIFVLFAIISCQHQQKKESTVYLGTTDKEYPPDSLFSTVNLIYLKESDSLVIGTINKIAKNESVYYLLDSKKSKSIFAFNEDGNYIARYHALGSGPEEYTSIIDFDIDTIKNEIVILCSPPKLIITDLQLSLKREISLDGISYDRIIVIEDDIFLFNYYDELIGKYDNNGKLVKKIPSTTKLNKGNTFHPQPVFYRLRNICLMQSPGDDIVYKEENGEWIDYFYIDYENKKRSMKLYAQKNEEEITFEKKVLNPLPYIKYFFESRGKTYFVYLFGIMHYLNDGENNFIFSELPGRSLSYHNGYLCGWEWISDFNPENLFEMINKHDATSHSEQKNTDEIDDAIVLIEYAIRK